MVRDARNILNMKRKRQNQQQNRPYNQGIKKNNIQDARQILRRKFSQQNFRSNNTGRGFIQRQFKQAFVQQSSFKGRVPKSNLKISPRPRNAISNIQKRDQNVNRVVSDRSGITVVMRNNRQTEDEIDNDDDLEHMTIEDIPEINIRKECPYFLPKQATPVSVRSNQKDNTMIADRIGNPSTSSQLSWKVTVSNLQAIVTQEDIMELFGHIGNIKNAQIIRPGTAVVEYSTKEDAVTAYTMYNDRLLDGAPMICKIQSGSATNRVPVSSRLGSKFTSASSSFFQRSTAGISQPQKRVAFTVKLP